MVITRRCGRSRLQPARQPPGDVAAETWHERSDWAQFFQHADRGTDRCTLAGIVVGHLADDGACSRGDTFKFSRFYPDRNGQGVPTGISCTFIEDGVPQVDIRNWLYYNAIGNSPGIMAKNVGQGSQYLRTYRDADGSVDIDFGPDEPKGERNWIRTAPGKGWFPFFRCYGPTEAYFDQTWKLEDIMRTEP